MPDCFGLLYDRSFAPAMAEHAGRIDVLEIIPDRYFDSDDDPLFATPARPPLVFHSLNLSLGADEPLDELYLGRLEALAGRLQPLWASDHLAVSQLEGFELGHLSPIRWSEAAVDRVAAKAALVQTRLGIPFLIENITYYFRIPGAEIAETELLRRIAEAAGCGLLLDLNNVAVNAANHGFDAFAYLDAFPLEAVREIHLAGQRRQGAFQLDSHDRPVGAPVWEMLRHVRGRIGEVAVILERDHDIPPLVDLIGELDIARRCLAAGAPEPVA